MVSPDGVFEAGLDEVDASGCPRLVVDEEQIMQLVPESRDEREFHWAAVLGIAGVAATVLTGELLKRRGVFRLPEAAVGVLVGALQAALVSFKLESDTMLDTERFSDEFFMVWLLPPIIFAAGFNMNVHAFFANLGPTMLFAFGGTLLSAAVVGIFVYMVGQMGMCYQLSLLASLFFGSLISATDPVTVLAVFKVMDVRENIFAIIFGESVLNDAVAIVLARTVLAFNKPGAQVGAYAMFHAVLVFCVIFVGSMATGVLAGVLASLLFKYLRLREHHDKQVMEAALSFAFPWASYYAAEALELSGIVAILFCGIVMAAYGRSNLSDEGIALTRDLFECLAVIAEAFVFNYLGMATFAFPILADIEWRFVLVALLACFLGRLHVFLGIGTLKCIATHPTWVFSQRVLTPGENKRRGSLTWRHAFLIWFSGLRGGVAFALAAASFADDDFANQCGQPTGDAGSNGTAVGPTQNCGERNDGLVIMQATLLIAIFTIFVFGGLIRDVALKCDVLRPAAPDLADVAPPSLPMGAKWRKINDRYIVPRLTHIPSKTESEVSSTGTEVSRRTTDSLMPTHGSSALLATQQRPWSTELVPAADSNGAAAAPNGGAVPSSSSTDGVGPLPSRKSASDRLGGGASVSNSC